MLKFTALRQVNWPAATCKCFSTGLQSVASKLPGCQCHSASHWHATRAQSLMKMLRRVQNEMFTFKIDSEIALVDCTLGTLGGGVSANQNWEALKLSYAAICQLSICHCIVSPSSTATDQARILCRLLVNTIFRVQSV